MVLAERSVQLRLAVDRDRLARFFAACEAAGMSPAVARGYLRRCVELGLEVGVEQLPLYRKTGRVGLEKKLKKRVDT